MGECVTTVFLHLQFTIKSQATVRITDVFLNLIDDTQGGILKFRIDFEGLNGSNIKISKVGPIVFEICNTKVVTNPL